MPGERDESFPGKCRLRKSNDFRRVFVRGRRNAGRFFVIYALPNRLENSRLGIQVRRKIGTAVQRNRLKRMTREVFRKMKSELRESLDLVLIAEKPMTELRLQDLDSAFRTALQRYLK